MSTSSYAFSEQHTTQILEHCLKEKPPTLSRYLLDKAEHLFGYPRRIPYDPKSAAFLSEVVENLWNARLGPVAEGPESPGVPDKILDEFLCRVLLRKVPAIVQRMVTFPAFETRRRPPEDVVVCSGEASRCFVFGFWGACVALSRAALETSLKQELRGRGIPPPEKLSEVIDRSRTLRILDDLTQKAAGVIKDKGDKVLHGERASQKPYHADEAAAETTLRAFAPYSPISMD